MSKKESKQKTIKELVGTPKVKKTKKAIETLLSKYSFEYKRVKTSEIMVDVVKPNGGLKESRRLLGETNDVVLNEVPNLDAGKKYGVIDGRKRINDSLEEGREEINAKVYKNLPVELANDITIVQNLNRSLSPVIEAEKIQEEVKRGKTLPEISKVTGVSLSVLRQRLSLLKLPKSILEKLRRNEVRLTVAKKIVGLPLDVQNKIAKEEKITGEVVEQHHRSVLNSQINFKDVELPQKPDGKVSVKNYHVKCGKKEKDMMRKELISVIDEMLAGLMKGEELVITRK